MWRSVEGLEGVKGRVGLDGVVLVFGALSISPIFPVLVLSPKKGFGRKSGLTLTFHGSLPCSHVITSPCRVVLGPSHLKPFHLPSNSEFGTGYVMWRSVTFISFRSLRFCITSLISVSLGTLCMDIIIIPSRFEKE